MAIDVDSLIALALGKNFPIEKLINSVENYVTESYAEWPDALPQGRAVLNRETGEILVHVPQYDENGVYTHSITHMPEGFERTIDRTVKKALKDQFRASKDLQIVTEVSTSVGDVISGIVQQGRDPEVIYVNIGIAEAIVPATEQVPTEHFKHGDRMKAFVVKAERGRKGPEIILSRTHPLLVRALFALEVPEIKDRIVDVVGVAREPGSRSKISVRSHRAGVSAKGALIGPGGARTKAVTDELHGEKIDIVDWSDDLAQYVANALAPAKVSSAEVVDAQSKSVKVIVPDYQLSLAIGKDGQNARLAARLTGARIDIHPDNPVRRITGVEQSL